MGKKQKRNNMALEMAIIIIATAIASVVVYLAATKVDVPVQKHEIYERPAPATEQSRASVSAGEQPVQSAVR